VEDYLDKFQSLILKANYTNLHTIVVKFCKSLDTTIQNQTVIMLVGKLDDIDSVAWFKPIWYSD